jgi:TetR/AcrR family transcriptional regulator, transcriptional repressor for nem operon
MNTKQSTRDKILDTVFTLVYINGYNGTSMSMILKECDIPKGSLYHYFKSKKEMVLSVLKERISPRMDDFYELKKVDNEHSINTIINSILRVSQKEVLVKYGCPLNRLNQEMSPVDKDFEFEINIIYQKIKNNILLLLENTKFNQDIDKDSLSEFIITTVWGNLSLSPTQSSKDRYLKSVAHLINYLKSLKV